MNNDVTAEPNEPMHPIKAVANRTGLSVHVIRVWEKRYHAVTPKRTETNRRLYSDADINRLKLLKKATDGGHNIGQIANLPFEKLCRLTEQNTDTPASENNVAPQTHQHPASYIQNAIEATKNFDAQTLQSVLAHAAVAMSQILLIENVIVPFMYQIGNLWHHGDLRISHEHLASSVTRAFLENLKTTYSIPTSAPNIIVTTPSGQLHELGAAIVSTIASGKGWQVTYLGASLPAEEIAAAATQQKSRAVALSLIYPSDDPNIKTELVKLHNNLPSTTALLIGGSAAQNYNDIIQEIGAIPVSDVISLQEHLDHLRTL